MTEPIRPYLYKCNRCKWEWYSIWEDKKKVFCTAPGCGECKDIEFIKKEEEWRVRGGKRGN